MNYKITIHTQKRTKMDWICIEKGKLFVIIRKRAMKKNCEEFEKAIQGFSDNIKDIARHTRQFIFDILPNAVEVVWVQQKNIWFGTGVKKKQNIFVG